MKTSQDKNPKKESPATYKEQLLSAVAQSAQRLLEADDWKLEINEVLRLLGESAQSSHAYLFENHLDENKNPVTSLRYEWANPLHPVTSHINAYQNVPLKHEEMQEWYELMLANQPFYDSTESFPEEWQSKESRKEIKVLLDMPIFIGDEWWGVIGFDDCIRVHPWSQAEIDAMQIAARLLGSIIKQQHDTEELRASEKKFETTFNASLVPMVISRVSDRLILDANTAFTALTGYTHDEAINQYATELRLWVDNSEREAHRKILKAQGYLQEFKAHIRKKNGEIGVVLISVTTVKVNLEDCLLYSMHEITQLEKALTELQDKNNELERFTYTVSHDLKAPLITIGGFAGLLAKDLAEGKIDKSHHSIQRILDAVNKMERLLNELLELSRVGRMINEPQEVSFEAIAREAVSLAQGRLRAHQISVEIEAGLPNVKVDRVRIVEVLQNLLDNAAKFMGEQKNPSIKIGAKKDDNVWIFFVQDNGIGIEPDFHERVFGLFNKLDANSEGTGVGLALVRRIIEFHAGTIWVESAGKNQGSTFYFALPVA